MGHEMHSVRRRNGRQLCRESWYQQVTSEQKQLAEETASCHRSLEAARAADLAARRAALEFEARAKLASKEVNDTRGLTVRYHLR